MAAAPHTYGLPSRINLPTQHFRNWWLATFSRPGVSSFPAHRLPSLNATRVFAAAVPPCLAVRRLSHTIRPLPSMSPASRMTQHDYSESCVTNP